MQGGRPFSVGDLVSQRGGVPERVGMVVKVYGWGGQRRFVVRFEDGSESVFFWFELVAADEAADQAE